MPEVIVQRPAIDEQIAEVELVLASRHGTGIAWNDGGVALRRLKALAAALETLKQVRAERASAEGSFASVIPESGA